MKITKTELKKLIREALRDELRKPTRARKLREFIDRGKYSTLSDFYNNNEMISNYDLWDIFDDEEKTNAFLADWLNVEELKKYSAESIYNQLKNDNSKVLVLHGDDIGDGHGDRMSYIFSINKNLYILNITSNGSNVEKINSYQEFKNHIYFEDLWQKISVENLNERTGDYYYDISPYLLDCIASRDEGIIDDEELNELLGEELDTEYYPNSLYYTFVDDFNMPQKFLNSTPNNDFKSKEENKDDTSRQISEVKIITFEPQAYDGTNYENQFHYYSFHDPKQAVDFLVKSQGYSARDLKNIYTDDVMLAPNDEDEVKNIDLSHLYDLTIHLCDDAEDFPGDFMDADGNNLIYIGIDNDSYFDLSHGFNALYDNLFADVKNMWNITSEAQLRKIVQEKEKQITDPKILDP